MEKLNFSYNWNGKLDCQAFTTIRLSNKYVVGQTLQVFLKDRFLGLAQVFDIAELKSVYELNIWQAMLDTGYDITETQTVIYNLNGKDHFIKDWSKKKVYVLYLRYLENKMLFFNLNDYDMQPNRIVIPENYNHKLDCNAFTVLIPEKANPEVDIFQGEILKGKAVVKECCSVPVSKMTHRISMLEFGLPANDGIALYQSHFGSQEKAYLHLIKYQTENY